METPRDGQKVAYVGLDDEAGLRLGDHGQVVAADIRASHVLWITGTRANQIDLIVNEDIAPSGKSAVIVAGPLDDSLAYGSLVSTGVRDLYDESGEAGVLNSLAESGHLSSLALVAEEALTFVAERIRTDASISAVLSQLEPEEADALVLLAAQVVLRDTFGQDGDI